MKDCEAASMTSRTASFNCPKCRNAGLIYTPGCRRRGTIDIVKWCSCKIGRLLRRKGKRCL